jgi:serine/threonine-protein phosphatase 2A regulatory subunit B
MGDMRVSAISDNTAINFKYDPSGPKNFFTEVISAYNSVKFVKNERYIVARDFLTVKVWDLAMSNKPVTTIPIHESLKSKLC